MAASLSPSCLHLLALQKKNAMATFLLPSPSLLRCSSAKEEEEEGDGIAVACFFLFLSLQKKKGDGNVVAVAFFVALQRSAAK